MDLCKALKDCLTEIPISSCLSTYSDSQQSVGEAANAFIGPTYFFKCFLGIIKMMCLSRWAALLDAGDVSWFIFLSLKPGQWQGSRALELSRKESAQESGKAPSSFPSAQRSRDLSAVFFQPSFCVAM